MGATRRRGVAVLWAALATACVRPEAMPELSRGLGAPAADALSDAERAIVGRTASDLARRIAGRELSSQQVVRAFIARIHQVDAAYGAIVLLDAEGALKRAAEADAALARGESWGPLHGVPVTLKDSYSTRGLRTTAGDASLAEYVPTEDAVAVTLLRRAGAIVLAKTNLATLAMDMQTTNALFGTTRNPWNSARTAGGSSGGCATAVALHMSPLSFGSDLAGSIRVPASYTGVYGLKPTRGVVSMKGHVPPRPGEIDGIRTMAVLGPIARSVEDLELALTVLNQPAPGDVPPAPLRPARDVPATVAGLRIAWQESLGGVPVSREVAQAMHRTVEALRAAGATVVRAEPAGFSYPRTWETWGALVGMQGGYDRSNFARWMGSVFASGAVEDIPHQRRILEPISVPGYMVALTTQAEQAEALERFLADYDAWLVPNTPTTAFPHHAPSRSYGDFHVYDEPLLIDDTPVPYYVATQAYTALFSVTENPVVAMPAGLSSDGLPVGVQCVGRRYEDLRLLKVAALLEPLLPALSPPSAHELQGGGRPHDGG
jgi:amidase